MGQNKHRCGLKRDRTAAGSSCPECWGVLLLEAAVRDGLIGASGLQWPFGDCHHISCCRQGQGGQQQSLPRRFVGFGLQKVHFLCNAVRVDGGLKGAGTWHLKSRLGSWAAGLSSSCCGILCPAPKPTAADGTWWSLWVPTQSILWFYDLNVCVGWAKPNNRTHFNCVSSLDSALLA